MRDGVVRPIDDDLVLEQLDRALPEVYGYLLHRCRSKAVAEDLTSETFLAAVTSIRQGTLNDPSTAWLIGVARHKLSDHWRREARQERHLAAVAEREVVANDPFDEAEPGRGMYVLSSLNPMQRAALVLRHVDGLPVPSVADLLGRSITATETLLARARAAFRHRYQADALLPGNELETES